MAETQKNLEEILNDKGLLEKWANFLEQDPEAIEAFRQDINNDFSQLKGDHEKQDFIKLLEQGPESFEKTINQIGDEVLNLEETLGRESMSDLSVQEPNALRQVLQDMMSKVLADGISKPEQEQGEKGQLAWDSVEVGQKVVFQPHNSKTELKGTVKEIDGGKVTLQCGRVSIPVTQDKGVLKAPPQKEIAVKSNDKSIGIDL